MNSISKEQLWKAMIEPAVKSCLNCKRGWDCTFNVPECTDNLKAKKPEHWIWDEIK